VWSVAGICGHGRIQKRWRARGGARDAAEPECLYLGHARRACLSNDCSRLRTSARRAEFSSQHSAEGAEISGSATGPCASISETIETTPAPANCSIIAPTTKTSCYQKTYCQNEGSGELFRRPRRSATSHTVQILGLPLSCSQRRNERLTPSGEAGGGGVRYAGQAITLGVESLLPYIARKGVASGAPDD